jgi:hypothetical protein
VNPMPEHELRDLIDAVCCDALPDELVEPLESALHDNATNRQQYFQAIALTTNIHFWLRAENSATRAIDALQLKLEHQPHAPTAVRPLVFRRFHRWTTHSSFAAIAIAALTFYGTFAVLVWTMSWRGEQPRGRDLVHDLLSTAQVTASDEVRWSQHSSKPDQDQSIAAHESLSIDAGIVEVELKRGTKLIVQAPAKWVIEGENKATLLAGKLVATVPLNAIGFTLETPTARIVDLGTEFAAEVGAEQKTEIHVFKGTVIAQRVAPAGKPRETVRLSAGDAIAIDRRSDSFSSIPIRSDHYVKTVKSKPKSVIVAVQTTNGSKYQIIPGGLHEDARAYVDRSFEWNGIDKNGIPPALIGADYVQTVNEDKRDHNLNVYVTLSVPATLYLFFDNRASAPPEWLSNFFVDTGWEIGLDAIPAIEKGPAESVDATFSIWKRHVKAGSEWLGPSSIVRSGAHYGFAAVADSTAQDKAKTKEE